MPATGNSWKETQTNMTATTNGTTLDLRGYNKLVAQIIVGTCTDGGAGHTAQFLIQHSNDNSNWMTLNAVTSDAQPTGWDEQTYLRSFPDAAAAGNGGHFARYVRWRVVVGAGDTVSVNFNILWEATV